VGGLYEPITTTLPAWTMDDLRNFEQIAVKLTAACNLERIVGGTTGIAHQPGVFATGLALPRNRLERYATIAVKPFEPAD